MKIYYDPDLTYPITRLHPYVAADQSQSGYVDFVKQPDQIPVVLEDFRPFSDKEAVRTFYDFLRWLNGTESNFQSCDCALRRPSKHSDTNSHYALSTTGRLFIMFRNLKLNCSEAHTDWLCRRLMRQLSETDQGMSAAEGVVGFTLNPVLHLDLSTGSWRGPGEYEAADDDPGHGRHLMLSFFAYGNDEALAFNNLDRVFGNIWSACRPLSQEVQDALTAAAHRSG